jgi:predicted GIY-YIG superfamily endonuclease
MLRGASGRHYLGSTSDLKSRLEQHRRGHTHSTSRLGGDLQLIANKAYETRGEALSVERKLKTWKNPTKAQAFLNS